MNNNGSYKYNSHEWNQKKRDCITESITVTFNNLLLTLKSLKYVFIVFFR